MACPLWMVIFLPLTLFSSIFCREIGSIRLYKHPKWKRSSFEYVLSLPCDRSNFLSDYFRCHSLGEAVFFLRPRYSSLGTCIFQYLPHGIFAFLSSSQTLSSWRVERLNGSLSNICVQLRSNQAFQIPVSWRRGGENIREAVWASRRYFGICWMWTNERTVANRIQLAE